MLNQCTAKRRASNLLDLFAVRSDSLCDIRECLRNRVGRAVDMLCAEVDEDDIEPPTGTSLEDDCALAFEYFFQISEFT